MNRWIENFQDGQILYFAACEILCRRLMSLDVPVEPLGSHFGILAGYAFKSNDYTSAGIRLLRNINVKPDHIDWTEAVHLPEEQVREFRRFRLAAGDLVLSMDGTVNRQGIKIAFLTDHDVPSLLLQRVCRFEPTGTVDRRFLYHILHSTGFLDHLDDSNRSIAIPHVSPGQLKSFEIPIPTVELQSEICDFLDAVRSGDTPPTEWPDLPAMLKGQRQAITLIGDLHTVRQIQTAAAAETGALFFSILDRASRGEP